MNMALFCKKSFVVSSKRTIWKSSFPSEIELPALQSQIHPHFLYNTFEVIYWKACSFTGMPHGGTVLAGHLSDILKYAPGDPKHVPLPDLRAGIIRCAFEASRAGGPWRK